VGIVIKQSAYASAINYLGVAIGAINTIFLYPAFLTKSELGLLKAIFAMAIILAPFAQFGLGRSTLRFFPRFSASNKTKGRFLSLILMLASICIAIFLLLFQVFDDWIFNYFREKAPELAHHYWLILILAFLMVYMAIFEAYYRALLNVVIPAFFREFFLRISSTIIVFLYFKNLIDFQLFLYLSVISYAVSILLLVLVLKAKNLLFFNFSVFQIEKSFLRELSKYMLFIMAGAVGAVIVLQIDQLMVTAYLGLEQNAIYIVAFFMATVIEIPRRAIAPMSDSLIAKAFEYERIDDVKRIYKQSSINQLILGCFVFLCIILNLDNIYEIMPKGDAYKAGASVVFFIGLSKLIDMGFGVNSEIIVSSKLYRFNIYFVVVLAFLTIMLNALLIPVYGLAGAAIASLSAVFLFNFLKLIFIWRRLKFQPFSWHSLSVVGIALSCYFLVSIIPNLKNPFLNLLWITAVVTFSFILLTLVLKPSKEIDQIVKQLKSRIGI